MTFVEWAEGRYLRPVVVVDATAAADAACLRSGFDFVQLLRPFSVLGNSSLTAHVGEKGETVSVTNFGVRLMRRQCVREVSANGVHRHMQSIMRGAAAMDLAYGEQLDTAVRELISPKTGGPAPSPARMSSPAAASILLERSHPVWHQQFVRDYHALVRCGGFETTDHPVGFIFAASTSEPGGIDGILRAFKSQTQQARQLLAELPGMDAEVHQYYILLHDVTGQEAQQQQQQQQHERVAASTSSPLAPTLQDARKCLAAVQQLHGSNYCALIKVNSVANPQDVKCLDPAPWMEASPLHLDVPSEAAAAAEAPSRAGGSAAAGAAAAAAAARRTSLTHPAPTHEAVPHASERGCGVRPPFNQLHSMLGKWPNGTGKVMGCYMSPEDVAEVREVMGYYLSVSLFRAIERRLRLLDAGVQDRRTTTLSKVANWFKSKEEHQPRVEAVRYSTDGRPPQYLASSLEMMMRRCADLSMCLRDYSGAVGFYKMCIEELMNTLSQRPFNRLVIAGCQEGIGIAHFFLGKLTMPSATPWYTAGTRPSVKSSHTCRLEVALNDYLASGAQTYAMRMGLFLYEYCRTRSPPAIDRAKAYLQYILRSGLANRDGLVAGVVSDALATTSLFMNPPYPAGLVTSPTGNVWALVGTGAFTMPANYPVEFRLRTYIRFLLEAGARYDEVHAPETALRCYLRVLEVLRVLGSRGSWQEMYEHVLMTVSRLYFTLGQSIKGLVMASAAVAQGVPFYSNSESGLANFQVFWARQAKVLAGMGYSLSPHMPMPCITRSSFQISYDTYFTDDITQAEGKRLGKQTVEQEWGEVESHLKRHFHKEVLDGTATATSCYKFPSYHGELRQDYIFSDGSEASRPSVVPGSARKHYRIAHTESLRLSFVFHNPVGGALTASNISILYMSRQKPDQLWKSAAVRTVTLEPGAKEAVDLLFSPLEPGEYAVIGLCWSLLGQEGYYYFATKEGCKGCSETLYEYAIEHPAPSLDAEENILVTVAAPRAWVTATLTPPLPPRLRDGEYYHTNLVVTNGSAKETATSVTLQRSPKNAHLLYMEDFGITRNLRKEAALLLADTLGPGESRHFKLTVRAQHDRGDATVRCVNHLFFMLGYIPGGPNAPAAGETPSVKGPGDQRDFCGNLVRLHRLLRCFEVVPLMALYSTVLPPSNASLASAVVVTAKHIATAAGSPAPAWTQRSPFATQPSRNGATEGGPHPTQLDGPAKPPVRLCRLMTLHRAQWSVNCACTSDLTADKAALDCVIPAGSSLTLPILVRRLPREGAGECGGGPVGEQSPTEDEELLEDLDSDAEEARPHGAPCPEGSLVYVDEECLPLDLALPCATEAQALVASVGAGLAGSAMNRYFMRTSFLGAGSVGNAPERQGEALAFYLDKAGQAAETKDERRLAERQNERRVYGGVLEKYTPLVIAVAWAVGQGPDAPPSVGQLFHFVDPVSFLQSAAPSNAYANGATNELPGATASVEQQQQHLCECLTRNRITPAVQQGAVVYHARVPARVETTASLPAAALAPVLFRCLSLSPVPLLVEVAAGTPESIAHSHGESLSLVFVGKSKHSFLLLPSTVHEVEFAAHILVPGLTNCNCFHVVAAPLLFQLGLGLSTGMSKSEIVRRVRSAVACAAAPPTAGNAVLSAAGHPADPSAALDDEVEASNATGQTGSPGLGRPASASSFSASARSRTAKAAQHHLLQWQGSGSVVAGPSLTASAREGVDEFFIGLMPRGFHTERVRVLGHEVPALTSACFLHLGWPPEQQRREGEEGKAPLTYQGASEVVLRTRAERYADDLVAYEGRVRQFQERERARAKQSGGHVTYVYRPRVRVLSTAKGSLPCRGAATAKRAGDDAPGASVALAEGRGRPPPTTAAPSMDDLFGPQNPLLPPPSASTAEAAAVAVASASTFSGSFAAPVAAAGVGVNPTSFATSPECPHGLVSLEQLMPETPAKVRLTGVHHPTSTATPSPPDGGGGVERAAETEAGAAKGDAAPHRQRSVSPSAHTNPLGGGASATEDGEGNHSPSTQLLASPLHLPAHTRTFSQRAVDVAGDWADSSGVTSPLLLPHDTSRVAFPVTEEEDTSIPSGLGGNHAAVLMTAGPAAADDTGDTSLVVGLVIEEELLPPSQVQQQAVAQQIAQSSASRRQLRRDPFATSSSSSSTEEYSPVSASPLA